MGVYWGDPKPPLRHGATVRRPTTFRGGWRRLAVLLQPPPPGAARDRRDLDGLALRALGRVHVTVVDHLEQSSRPRPSPAGRPSRPRAA